MTGPHRSEDAPSSEDDPNVSDDRRRATPSFDDALRGYSRDETVDPANPGDGRRIEADRVPPAPITPGRHWTIGAFAPLAALLGAFATAIYVWMRAS